MKSIRWIASIKIIMCVTGVAGVTGCVSPFYGTARIEKGFHAELGVVGMTYIGAYGEWTAPSMGVMGNVSLRYGFNPCVQLGTRLGLGYGQTGWGVVDDAGKFHNPWEVFPDAALNIQAAIPGEKTTPALQIEGSYSHGASAALLIGLSNPERLTLGVRCNYGGRYAIAGLDLFVIGRPLPKMSLFLAVNPVASFIAGDGFWPVATLGVGYKLK